MNSEVVFSTRNYLTILNSMNFRGQNSSYKNLKKKSHQACTVWKRFELCLLQCVKTCDFLFILQSSFSNQPTISHSQYFIGKNHISTASSSSSFSSLESSIFFATAFMNLYLLFSNHQIIHKRSSSSFQGSNVFCSGNVKFMLQLLALRTTENFV